MQECQNHADRCGAGNCLLLHLKTSNVLVMRGDRCSWWGSPYLDTHGEEDLYLHRGRPLRLDTKRYQELERLWMSQTLDHDSHILKATEIVDEW